MSFAEHIVRALALADAPRTTLSKDLGVSRTTLNRVLAGLMEAGFVTASSRSDGRRGRPAEFLHLDRSVAYTAGIALSKQVGRAVIVNRAGEVLLAVRREVGTSSWQGALRDLCEDLLEPARGKGVDPLVMSVGVGVPVPVAGNRSIFERTRRIVAQAFPGIEAEVVDPGAEPGRVGGERAGDGPEGELARTALTVDNIVTMAAIGEARWGVGMAAASLLYVQLSAGIASCVVTPRAVTGGVTGVASELGHTLVPGLRGMCFCGKVGCLETVASVPAILEASGADSVEELARMLEQASVGEAGRDLPVHDVVARAAHAVGLAVANAVLVTNPEMVVLGGPLARAVDFYVSEVHRSLTEHLLPALGWDVDVVSSGMDEWGAARGAALAASQLLELSDAARILGGEHDPRGNRWFGGRRAWGWGRDSLRPDSGLYPGPGAAFGCCGFPGHCGVDGVRVHHPARAGGSGQLA